MIIRLLNSVELAYKRVSYGKNLKINGLLFLQGKPSSIFIGNDVTINSCLRSNPVFGSYRTVLATYGDGSIFIGNNVGISNAVIISKCCICIEDSVFIGAGVKIWDTDFHSISFDSRISNSSKCESVGKVLIKEGAFIGAGSILLKGVMIGRHSVVGAGSVVTKDIPDNEIWGGNPAKFIRILE